MDDQAKRAEVRRAQGFETRLIRPGQAQDRSFDVAFWQKQGPDAIWAAAWQMVREVHAIRGENVDEQRLQRSVSRLERRRR